jgi:drug/metabolite transporter (DMT)-like permease
MTAPSAARSGNLYGMTLMLGATIVLIGQHTMVKYLSTDLHTFQIVFFRTVTALVFFLPWMLQSRQSILHTRRLGLHLVRAALQMVSALSFFFGLAVTPLATVTALHFTAPVFATLIAVFVLREAISVRRWSAIFLGFAGTYVILRPGLAEVPFGALMVVVSALSWGVAMVLIKILSRTDSSVTTTAYMYLLMTPMTFVAALIDWRWPTLAQYGWLLLIGVTGAAAHLLMAESLKQGDTHVVTPIDFFRLIWAALIGYFLFGEIPDAFTWIGGSMIIVSVSYIVWREHRVRSAAAGRAAGGAHG